ncbi:TetR/AcrR family transcriptional regulator [Aquamicrobium sp.]|uniref:TetR/AcrR family transcriptional regulator n=1 Tax=Aquamicrobium sp. TaxID=1872579 RepID=UPI00258D8EE3|nr:TetR/AcrR family transcriptional regulator [Aquamicrobium sp.]MCK9551318.1 TetR/AcrR family transcriptional regulator [Aquamicrobium sp.]
MSRGEKARATLDSLLNAGCAVVAAEGYSDASVAKIADLAGVAHGTFYNYFEDRKALFNALLPYEGLRMREKIEQIARTAPPGVQREIVRFEAFLNYVIENEGFYRILYEAEIFAPEAHREHMDNIVNGYLGTFRRAMAENRIRRFDDQQLHCLIYQILGMRAYAAMQIHYAADQSEKLGIRDCSVEMYGLFFGQSLLQT